MKHPITVVIPAFNEAAALERVVKDIQGVLDPFSVAYEIIVVDDGSTDETAEVVSRFPVRLISHPENLGYGASLKTGIRQARYDRIVITDADGTYDVTAIPELAQQLNKYHMVVGARQGDVYRGSWMKLGARRLFRFVAEFATGRSIPDINSGLRAFRKAAVMRFLKIAGNRFSFTTTMTLALMLNGYFVKYVPVGYFSRVGESKVSHLRDTLRAAQVIVQTILYYNPLKLFLLPTGFLAFAATALALAALIARDAVLLLGAAVLGVGAVLTGGIGLIADLVGRHRLPR